MISIAAPHGGAVGTIPAALPVPFGTFWHLLAPFGTFWHLLAKWHLAKGGIRILDESLVFQRGFVHYDFENEQA